MNVPFVDLKTQYENIKDEVRERFERILKEAQFVLGPDVYEFENGFAKYLGVKHVISCANGTDALTLALRALNVGPGDEVILPVNTFIATAEAVLNVGATPVFVDVDPKYYNIDPNLIEEKISPRTKAIIPVHLYGQCAYMDEIMDIAKRYNLYIIEDACQAHGSSYKGRKAGTFGEISCFSFYPGKNLGAYGDGGACATNNDNYAEILRKLRNHGGVAKYQHDISGYNSRLDTLQAAVLCVKLKYLNQWNEMRRKNARIYTERLRELDGIETPAEMPEAYHVYHLYVIRVKKGKRDDLQRFLGEKGIQTGIHYPTPLHLTLALKSLSYKEGDFPVAEEIAREILSLPMYPELQEDKINWVVDKIKEFLGR